MEIRWCVTIDNDLGGTVIFDVPANEIPDMVGKILKEWVSSANRKNISMISVIMRVEVSHQTEGK
jgi:hypothetical protein